MKQKKIVIHFNASMTSLSTLLRAHATCGWYEDTLEGRHLNGKLMQRSTALQPNYYTQLENAK